MFVCGLETHKHILPEALSWSVKQLSMCCMLADGATCTTQLLHSPVLQLNGTGTSASRTASNNVSLLSTSTVNLDLVKGVSFNKGCYPGQEIVARLHYLGNPSRRMFYAETSTEEPPIVGEEVLTETGEVAGHIVHSQIKNSNKLKLLLSLKLSEQENKLFINDSIPIELNINAFNIDG